MKQVILIRGLPGSGKSWLAKQLVGPRCGRCGVCYVHLESDQFRINSEGEYEWTPENNITAHDDCKAHFVDALKREVPWVVVSNTFTRIWEMDFFRSTAQTFGYQVTILHVETELDDFELAVRGVHSVPEEVIAKMRARWEPFSL